MVQSFRLSISAVPFAMLKISSLLICFLFFSVEKFVGEMIDHYSLNSEGKKCLEIILEREIVPDTRCHFTKLRLCSPGHKKL